MDVSAFDNHPNLWNNLIRACERFVALRDTGRERLPKHLVTQAKTALVDLSRPAKNSQAPVVALSPTIDKIETSESAKIARRFQEYLIVSGVVGLPDRLAPLNLPEPFLDWYPSWLDMILATITGSDVPYPDVMDDSFTKDLRFVLGLSVPAGAGVVDLKSAIGAGIFLKN